MLRNVRLASGLLWAATIALGLSLTDLTRAQYRRATPTTGILELPASAEPPDAALAPPAPRTASAPSQGSANSSPAASQPRPSAPAIAPSARGSKAAEVRINDNVIFVLRAGHGAQSAEDRAALAEKALSSAIDSATADEVRVEAQDDVAVIYVGKIPVTQLYPRDALLAGDASLEVHAAAIVARLREAMRSEQKRSAIASTVFSFSIVIFFGLLALYLIRKVGDLTSRARGWIHEHPDRIPVIRVQSIEVVRPALLRGAMLASLGFGKWFVQLGIAYGWLVFALSLFASTRAYTEKLTGFVIAPVSALMGRLAASLPMLLVAGIAGVALYILVRFVGLFFAAVARGETSLPWLPIDLAAPTSLLLRAAIIVGGIVFGAPVVTGDSEGALARSGSVVLGALALASTPLLACGVIGTVGVFLRRLRVGEFAEFGGRTGKVLEVGLLEVRLEDADGCEVRVPHLLSLVHPTRMLGSTPRVNVDVSIAPNAQIHVRELLMNAVAAVGERPSVQVVGIDSDAVHLRVFASIPSADAKTVLQMRVVEALAGAKITLARPRPPLPTTSS